MIFVTRALVRLISFLLLVILAVAGIVVAVFCISTGTSGPSLGKLASLLHLTTVRHTVGPWLGQLAASGSVAVIAGLCGLGAILLGLLLLTGLLAPRRERLVTLASDREGTIAARRRPLGQAAQTLVEQVRGVTEARARVRPRRRRRPGGRLRVRASRTRAADATQVRGAVDEQLRELTDPFPLKARVEVPRRGARVE